MAEYPITDDYVCPFCLEVIEDYKEYMEHLKLCDAREDADNV